MGGRGPEGIHNSPDPTGSVVVPKAFYLGLLDGDSRAHAERAIKGDEVPLTRRSLDELLVRNRTEAQRLEELNREFGNHILD